MGILYLINEGDEMSNERVYMAALVICVVVIAALAVYAFYPEEDPVESDRTEYEFESSVQSFHAQDDLNGTWVDGDMFVAETDEGVHAWMTCDYRVGPDDFGGVTLYVYDQFRITRVLSDQGRDLVTNAEYWEDGYSEEAPFYASLDLGIRQSSETGYGGSFLIEMEYVGEGHPEDIDYVFFLGSWETTEGYPAIGQTRTDFELTFPWAQTQA